MSNSKSVRRMLPLLTKNIQATAFAIAFVFAIGVAEQSTFAQAKNETKQKKDAPITKEEAEKYAEALEEALSTGDVQATSQLVLWDEVLRRATQLPNLPELSVQREQFSKGVVENFAKTGGFFAQFKQVIENGGTYRYLRMDLKPAEPYVMFRLTHPNRGGLNYHKFYLKRLPQGRIAAVDFYIMLSAENASEMLHRSWMPLATRIIRESGKASREELAKFDAEAKASEKIADLSQKGKFAELVDAYDQAPEGVRKNKSILVLRLVASQKVSIEAYEKAIEDFRKNFPNDPALDFILIDGHVLTQEYDKALKCVDRTIEFLGVDAELLNLRALVLFLQEKTQEALVVIKKAMETEPDCANAFTSALDITIAAKDDDETVVVLDALEKKFGYEWKDLREVEVFKDFVKSPQYKKWAEARAKKE